MTTSGQAVPVSGATEDRRRSRSGRRAPAGKAPLQVLVAEHVIVDAKIEAIRRKTNVSKVVDILIRGWLDGTYRLEQ
ncbi:hypothetical protein [Bradyrhizobium tunisiense]|uniref:hypothetical protein n=1 Tax=Bradyrhizobium tunisiense TaxID=3278709 RepID=UPI0035E0F8F5